MFVGLPLAVGGAALVERRDGRASVVGRREGEPSHERMGVEVDSFIRALSLDLFDAADFAR